MTFVDRHGDQEARDVVAALTDAPECDGQADAQRQERQ